MPETESDAGRYFERERETQFLLDDIPTMPSLSRSLRHSHAFS